MSEGQVGISESWGRLRVVFKDELTFTRMKDVAGYCGLSVEQLSHLQQLQGGGASKAQLLEGIERLMNRLSPVDKEAFISCCLDEMLRLKPDSRSAIERAIGSVRTASEARVSVPEPPPSRDSVLTMEEAPHPGQQTNIAANVLAFLCHASPDKETVRSLYARLRADGIRAWLDEEDLLPGQNWRMEIRKAIRQSDVVIVCLSKASVTKRGFVQSEIKFALDIAQEQPEGAIFIIPRS